MVTDYSIYAGMCAYCVIIGEFYPKKKEKKGQKVYF